MLKLWVFALALVPGLAVASDIRPAELPPADFLSRQYIDSRGCVFLLDDAGLWVPRVARDGSPICGYPPTLSARGIDGKPRLRALDPNAGRSRAELLEHALSETVLTNLRPGELASDPNPMEKLPDMGGEPASTGPSRALKAALAAAPAIRRNMGEALQPNRRLCELLGYDGGAAGPAAGRDPSRGYCSSLPESDLSRLTFVRPLTEIRQEGASQASAPAAQPAKVAAKVAAKQDKAAKSADDPNGKAVPVENARRAKAPAPGKVASGKAVSRKTVPAKPPAQGKAAAPAGGGLIPAGARYIQFGTYADAANADRAAQVVARMGYPVMRGRDRLGRKDVQFIMAGPFGDRESIVRALDAIRRAGFRDAYPR